jgi:hypothetical protein
MVLKVEDKGQTARQLLITLLFLSTKCLYSTDTAQKMWPNMQKMWGKAGLVRSILKLKVRAMATGHSRTGKEIC